MLQVSRLVVELTKVKSMSSLVRLDSRFGWFESVESTCSNHLSFESSCLSESGGVRFSISALCRLVVGRSSSLMCSSAPLYFRLRSFARSLVVVPSLSLVFRSVVLGVASSDNRRCSPRCRSSGLWVSSLLRAPECDETVPQCVSSTHDRLDSEWGVLCSESRSRWLVLDVLTSFRQEVSWQSVQPNDFLWCIWCFYVLSLCGRHDRALLKRQPPWYDTFAIGEDIAWCWLLIIRVSGIVGVRVAFDFGLIVRLESEPCVLGSSQIPKDVFDGLPMLPSWVWHVPVDPTACARSVWVATIVYMILPTVDA